MTADQRINALFTPEQRRSLHGVRAKLRSPGASVPSGQALLDRITQVAAGELHTPVACVSLVGPEYRLVTSSTGLPAPIALFHTWAFCKQVIASRCSLAVPDAREHRLLRTTPAVRDGLVIAFAGTPVMTANGRAVGTLSVSDPQPRPWTRPQIELLEALAVAIVAEIELGTLAAGPRVPRMLYSTPPTGDA